MSSRRAGGPPTKRVKLESDSPSRSPSIQEVSPHGGSIVKPGLEAESVDEEHCSICLQSFADRTLVPKCSHEFCFECLLIWTGEYHQYNKILLNLRIIGIDVNYWSTDQSRKCPLCSQAIGDYLIHHIRSTYDYQKHYLAPLRTSPRPHSAAIAAQRDARRRARTRREREWGRRQREAQEEADELELAIEKRRWIYRHRLYAKVCPHYSLRILGREQGESFLPEFVAFRDELIVGSRRVPAMGTIHHYCCMAPLRRRN